MKFAFACLGVSVILMALTACDARDRLPADGSIPQWLRHQVSEDGEPLPVIEQATYKGQPAFTTTATDRDDAGDEHSLFSADGQLLCRFGGIVGRVTSGSCELGEIVYVKTLYDPD
jgi:hypothetical protein